MTNNARNRARWAAVDAVLMVAAIVTVGYLNHFDGGGLMIGLLFSLLGMPIFLMRRAYWSRQSDLADRVPARSGADSLIQDR